MASLHLRLIEQLDRSDALAARRFDFEPLGRLWTAWRTAVRHS
jgi:hypothetical protein